MQRDRRLNQRTRPGLLARRNNQVPRNEHEPMARLVTATNQHVLATIKKSKRRHSAHVCVSRGEGEVQVRLACPQNVLCVVLVIADRSRSQINARGAARREQ